MAFLAVPGPFDFALTTERFRAFGVDRATVWHEDGLHRAVGGREVRIEAAPGGVDVEPLDAETEPVVRTVLGLAFDLEPFYAWAAADDVLGPATRRLRGFRPTLAPDPFEMLVAAITAQQVSLQSARRDPQPADRAVRHAGRPRLGVPARASGSRRRARRSSSRSASRAARPSTRSGSRAPTSTSHELAALPDDEVKARLVALRGIGEWTADWFLARHLARPHAWPWGDLALRKAVAHLYGGLRRPGGA